MKVAVGGLNSKLTLATLGAISLSNWTHLPPSDPAIGVNRSRCRPGAAGLQRTATHGIGHQHEHDGDGPRLLQHRPGGRRGARQNEVGLKPDQFLRQSSHRLDIHRRPARLDVDIATLCPPGLAQLVSERCDPGFPFNVALGIFHEHADVPHAVGLLRARRNLLYLTTIPAGANHLNGYAAAVPAALRWQGRKERTMALKIH